MACKGAESCIGHVLEISEVWKRYVTFASVANVENPTSYTTRHTTFKKKVMSYIQNVYECTVLRDQAVCERQTLFVPKKFSHITYSKMRRTDDSGDETSMIPSFKPREEDEFLSMVHLAMKLRYDI